MSAIVSILFILFIFAVTVGPVILVIVFIFRAKRRNDEQQQKMFDKAYSITEKKLEQELRETAHKKIVLCKYCGKYVMFDQGSCKNCGAKLEFQGDDYEKE